MTDTSDITIMNEGDLKLLIEGYGIDVKRANWIFEAIKLYKQTKGTKITPTLELVALRNAIATIKNRLSIIVDENHCRHIMSDGRCSRCKMLKEIRKLYEELTYG